MSVSKDPMDLIVGESASLNLRETVRVPHQPRGWYREKGTYPRRRCHFCSALYGYPNESYVSQNSHKTCFKPNHSMALAGETRQVYLVDYAEEEADESIDKGDNSYGVGRPIIRDVKNL